MSSRRRGSQSQIGKSTCVVPCASPWGIGDGLAWILFPVYVDRTDGWRQNGTGILALSPSLRVSVHPAVFRLMGCGRESGIWAAARRFSSRRKPPSRAVALPSRRKYWENSLVRAWPSLWVLPLVAWIAAADPHVPVGRPLIQSIAVRL